MPWSFWGIRIPKNEALMWLQSNLSGNLSIHWFVACKQLYQQSGVTNLNEPLFGANPYDAKIQVELDGTSSTLPTSAVQMNSFKLG